MAAREILKTESATPGFVGLMNGEVCKKLNFGLDKKVAQATMIRNYITNPKAEERKQMIDDMEDADDLDVGEEIPTIKRNRRDQTVVLPESKIHHNE